MINTLSNISFFNKETDGVIFTNHYYPYLSDRCLGVLKWKPAELNTVDFLIKPTEGVLAE